MYGFMIRPRWILSHLLALVLVGSMIWASFWQRGRLLEVRDRNERIVDRTAAQIVDVEDIAPLGMSLAEAEELEFRPVRAQGRFVRADEVVVRGRSLDGAPGSWVVTPLLIDDGRAVLVNRGWIPHSLGPDDDRPDVDPPTADVAVEGWGRPTQVQQGLGVKDAREGVLTSLARVDIARIEQQVDYELLPVFIQLNSQEPGPGDLPVQVALPELSEGSHFSYQMQWAIYALVGIVGYPLILRRVARNRRDDELFGTPGDLDSDT